MTMILSIETQGLWCEHVYFIWRMCSCFQIFLFNAWM